MSEKLCAHCGERPRHVQRSGKKMTRCLPCQRIVWQAAQDHAAKKRGDEVPVHRASTTEIERKPRYPKKMTNARRIEVLRLELIESRAECAKLRKMLAEMMVTV